MNEMQILGRIQEELRSQNESNKRLAKFYETLSELEGGESMEYNRQRLLYTLILSEWLNHSQLKAFIESGGTIRIMDSINGNKKETFITMITKL